MSTHIVIIGGGFGGLSLLHELQNAKPGVQVTLINASSTYTIGAAHQTILTKSNEKSTQNMGDGSSENLSEKLREKMKHTFYYEDLNLIQECDHLNYIHDVVMHVDYEEKVVRTRTREIEYDVLVISTGVVSDASGVKGVDASYDICSLRDVEMLGEAVRGYNGGGNVVVMISALPYKCPPAPYEYVMVLEAMLRETGVRDSTNVIIATPQPTPIPLKCPERVAGFLADKGIEFRGNVTPEMVDPVKREITFTNGDVLPYDILCGTYPQHAPAFLSDIATRKGFIPCNVDTLQTDIVDVYAMGDVAGPMLNTPKPKMHPKAGGFVENQAVTVALNIIDAIENGTPWGEAPFKQNLSATCLAETGDNQFAYITIDLFNENGPQFEVSDYQENFALLNQEWLDKRTDKWFKKH